MKRLPAVVCAFVLSVFLFHQPDALAAPKLEDIPEVLRTWTDWVLHGTEESVCPFFSGEEDKRICQWPGRLELSLTGTGGSFRQPWEVSADGWVTLPGDAKFWPQNVKSSGSAVAVVERDGKPAVYLAAGNYTISGDFLWDQTPEAFPIPLETGIIGVTVNGSAVDFPLRDEEGRLWIAKTGEGGEGAEENLDIHVYRRVTDDIPLLLTTRIDLAVSGKNREIQLGQALPAGFIPLSLAGDLPSRLEKDGRLRVQARAGNWSITLAARHESAAAEILLHDPSGLWASEEVWVFESQPSLRLAEVSGVPIIDPRQTTLPEEWMGFPAYRVKPGETFGIVQKKRGDEDPAPDDLALARTLWLDFDGAGFTVQDELSGLMRRGWRLEVAPPMQLGRVSIDGEDQFITRLKEKGPEGSLTQGVEIRQGRLNVTADSRLPRKAALSATGWNDDFQHVVAQLNLPPGWKLFGATGIDRVRNTWLNQWTLLDLFVVLMTALAIAKLFNVRWGVVALITLALSYKEVDAPRWIWLLVLAGETLCRYLPEGRIRSLFKFYRLGTWVVLIVWVVPFLIQQVREGIHPALEKVPYQYAPQQYYKGKGGAGFGTTGAPPPPAPEAVMQEQKAAPPMEEELSIPSKMMRKGEFSQPMNQMIDLKSLSQQNLYQQDPNALVQTGPGLTQWDWRKVSLEWSGPVGKNQTIRLFLISPLMNLLLSATRVFLLVLLTLCLFGFPLRRLKEFLQRRPVAGAGLFFLTISLLSVSPSVRADYPSDALLQALKDRLLEDPECYPDCASISRMQLEISGSTLRARLEVNALAETAVAIPGNLQDWSPQEILLDGETGAGVIRSDDGLLRLLVPEGPHQILLSGRLPAQPSVQLALPEKPHRVEVMTAEGWSVSGIQPDGAPEDNLTLTRGAVSVSPDEAVGETQQLPPFVRVERTFFLGMNWEMETRIVRLSPLGTAVVLEVPLVSGESVTTPDVVVHENRVNASLGPQVAELVWNSRLEIVPEINLKAPDTFSWASLWRLEAGPVWHVEAEGIPSIHQPDATDKRVPQWQPWPGESLKLAISRPAGVPGQTMTIDKSEMTITPGRRTSDITLRLDLRSSLGGQHAISLPKGAMVKSLTINGADQPIRMDKEKLVIPLSPGGQNISVGWLEPAGFSLRYQAPPVNLGAPSVNAETQIQVGGDRWILSLGGPRMGPAVLFWSFLVVILLAAIALSKLDFSPLNALSWILLGLGLTQVSALEALVVAGWLLFLGWRKQKSDLKGAFVYDMRQLLIVCWTVAALVILVESLRQGLLGQPRMQIAGNGSTSFELNWYQDRTNGALPRPWIISVPLYVYHLVMLAWAMWIAMALIRWLRFGWKAFGEGGLWRPLLRKKTM
ncbi:MAG: hypothetical protein HYU99_06840 [Deltaproteobacteria bacterium]|nr:hypothetical protein [Deltaproteobacteria bacterium]